MLRRHTNCLTMYILKCKVSPTVLHKRPAQNTPLRRQKRLHCKACSDVAVTSLQDAYRACARWMDAIFGLAGCRARGHRCSTCLGRAEKALRLVIIIIRPLQKSLRFCYFKSDCGEIWQDCSTSKYASIDGVGFPI